MIVVVFITRLQHAEALLWLRLCQGIDEQKGVDSNLMREQEMESDLVVRQATQVRTNDRRQAPLAECHALERRWAELHEEALHLDQQWQHLMSSIISRVETKRNGQSLNWTDGAAAFYDLDKHAARTSHLAQEALQTCHWYALALQRALDACARSNETEVVSAGAEAHPRVASADRPHRHALRRRSAADAGAGEDRQHEAPNRARHDG